MKKYGYILALFAFLTPSVLEAKHIVGGEITYRVVSSTATSVRYAFTMKIFRDCNSVGSADFDQIAPISVYNGQTGSRIESFGVPKGAIVRVQKPDYPCLNEPDVCVDEGTYTWEKDLPIIGASYILLYQRCCRNETITNIVLPGNVGATYSIEITAESQRLKNNSPTFKQFPPIIICANEALNFDHSAEDAEGDQLVYEFCQPLPGGGRVSSGTGNGCTDVAPNPPCWPPAGALVFRTPDYTYDKPVGGNPVVKIDARTGRITGTPREQGQYVVGVCVKEYRNGVLLSVIQRDFQFNVEPCDPTVRAKVKADSVWDKNYLIRACGDKAIKVSNLSVDQSIIGSDFLFTVDIGGQTQSYRDWLPTISFPDTGLFNGKLFLKPGTVCGDTINLLFQIAPSVHSNFTYAYDTCVAGPIEFTDRSYTAGTTVTRWEWDFGDGNFSTDRSPIHLYETPGEKKVRLRTTNGRGCQNDSIGNILWQPVPPLLIIAPSTFAGCSPASITFKNLSKPIDSTYKLEWQFGDGATGSAISPVHVYTTPGTYSISLKVTSPIGCKTSRDFPNLITVRQGALADFDFTPKEVTTFANNVSFFDRSRFANRWQWFFDDNGYSILQNPTFRFRDTGMHRIKLQVSNQYCSDTIVKFIDVIPKVTYWLPNAFSPNNDGNNDDYRGKGITEGMRNFKFQIFNRWGEKLFETNDPNEAWNGKKYNKDGDAPQDVYLCIVTFLTPRGENKELRSYATLVR